MKLEIPYLKMRDGRPRWEPGPGLRAKGFKGRDLKSENGDWLSEAAAIEVARELNREVAEWRGRGAPLRRARKSAKVAKSVDALWTLYTSSPAWKKLKPNTRSDYEGKGKIFLAEFGDKAVGAIRKAHLHTYWEELYEARGHAMANSIIAVARAMLSYGELKDWVTVNPAKGLQIESIEERCVIITPTEVAALMQASADISLPSVGDAIVLALHTGQRQADCLTLVEQSTENGRTAFKIGKTGARVLVPQTPALGERLAQIKQRRRAAIEGDGVVAIDKVRRVVLTEDGRDYNKNSFGKAWRQVRARAAYALHIAAIAEVTGETLANPIATAKGKPESHKATIAAFEAELAELAKRFHNNADAVHVIETRPELPDKLFLDLRDTAITRLALAGCTIPDIRSITGHSLETVHAVLKHYLAIDDRMAAAGIAKLTAYLAEEGIAI